MSFSENDYFFMAEARRLANEAAANFHEVPIGAVVVRDDEIIARAANMKEQKQCAVEHAELVVTREASSRLGRWRLIDCTLFVTLEPCLMCSGAIIQARYARVVFGCRDPKAGGMGGFYNLFSLPGLNHYPLLEEGLMAEECSRDLSLFFKRRRLENKSKKDSQL